MVVQDTITRDIQQDLQKVTQVLDDLVAEFGYDYVYPHARLEETGIGKCMYVENKDPENFDLIEGVEIEDLKPSCIIGHLAVRLGVDMEELRRVNEEGFSELCCYIYIPHCDPFRQELAQLQARQDKGMCWGEAVHLFKKETNNYGLVGH